MINFVQVFGVSQKQVAALCHITIQFVDNFLNDVAGKIDQDIS